MADSCSHLLNTPHDADEQNWSDNDVHQFLRSHGVEASGSRSNVQNKAAALLDSLYQNIVLPSSVNIDGLDPYQYPDFTLDQRAESPCQGLYLAGRVQTGFKKSFNAEQLSELIREGGVGMGGSTGTYPGFDMRLKIGLMFIEADTGTTSYTFLFLVPVEGNGKTNEVLEIRINRVVSITDSPVLVVQFLHVFGAMTKEDALELGQHLREVSRPPFQQCRVTRRQMQCLLKVLSFNRSLLKKTFVRNAEKPLNAPRFTWQVSVLTPFEEEKTRLAAARSINSMLKRSMVCAECLAQRNEVESRGHKLQCCQGCRSVWYCGKACQKKHWRIHKKECKPEAAIPFIKGIALRVGDQVEVHGLTDSVDLNGAQGTLQAFCEETDSWTVDLQVGLRQLKMQNLQQSVGRAVPQNQHVPVPCAISYEPPGLFDGALSITVPIQANIGLSLILNGEQVQPNTLRSNIHGSNVFVVKCQLMLAQSGPTNCIVVYDQLRHILLMIDPTEAGARGTAYKSLEAIALEKGGQVNSALKVYLFAQRYGKTVRVFHSRYPLQEQPF